MTAACEVSAGLRHLAQACAAMGSPFYGELFAQAQAAYEAGGNVRLLLDERADTPRLGLLLAGAAHFRALQDAAPEIAAHFPSTGGDGDASAAWRAIDADIAAHYGIYRDLLARTVQTNEVARALPLLAGMLSVAGATELPLRIFEIGSSAGFLLNLDRYGYTGQNWSWGPGESEVILRDRSAGRPRYLHAKLDIAERRGCDIAPVDVREPSAANRLLSFVWADQLERIQRARAAIAVARNFPPQIDRADAAAWLADGVQPRAGTATVVFHSVFVEHLRAAQRDALYDAIARLGRAASAGAPIAWVRMESPESNTGYETRVTMWPQGGETFVAASDGHAQHLRWIDASR